MSTSTSIHITHVFWTRYLIQVEHAGIREKFLGQGHSSFLAATDAPAAAPTHQAFGHLAQPQLLHHVTHSPVHVLLARGRIQVKLRDGVVGASVVGHERGTRGRVVEDGPEDRHE